jgi:hypothetical protein
VVKRRGGEDRRGEERICLAASCLFNVQNVTTFVLFVGYLIFFRYCKIITVRNRLKSVILLVSLCL